MFSLMHPNTHQAITKFTTVRLLLYGIAIIVIGESTILTIDTPGICTVDIIQNENGELIHVATNRD